MTIPSKMSNQPVLMLVSRRVKLGREPDFELRMAEFTKVAESFPGCLGVQLVHPGDEVTVDDTLYHALMAFDNQASLHAWQSSPERSRGLDSIAPFIEGVAAVRGISGLANWFQPKTNHRQIQPPSWKVAIVTWLGIFPTVYLLFLLLGNLLASWSLLARIFVLTILVVAIMTWWVAPQLTRLFRTWLYPTSQ